ncbi:MAG: SUMF1/EgtB/PvdO family nonheme iron enzyme, partial [Sinomicrobium sp.]|nr:SUMF1/EgtB/PvdO family nonheme iron enzyme [Sinomicrobium sp.]
GRHRNLISNDGTVRIQDWGSLLMEMAQLDSPQDDLNQFFVNFGLLYFDNKRNEIVIPSLVKKQRYETFFDITTSVTTYLTYRFERMPSDLLAYLHACFGAAGWGIVEFSNTGFCIEDEAFKMEVSSLGQHGIQFRLVGKNGLDINLDEVMGMVEASLKKGYKSLSKSLDQRTIPAYATPEMINVPGGTFTMGWLNEQRDGDGFFYEKPAHELKLNSFAIGRYPVTFEEYDAFCEAAGREKPEDEGWGRGRRPVIYVDWYDAVEYCNWLSEIWGLEQVYEVDKKQKDPNNKYENDPKKWLVTADENANGYRLLTEAEWEYAARGGQKSEGFLYAGSNDLDEVGWYGSNSGSKTHPVGEKQPNELGLHDMSGNVYEWCWDWFAGDYYQSSPEDNPGGPDQGSYRVNRGGNWNSNPQNCRAACRNNWNPANRNNNVGFRLARSS